jgi:hypothetical protein
MMSVELAVVGILLRTLHSDPTVPQLKLLNERVQRLAYGFCLDGASALEDAVGQRNPAERERLVSLALEYFRQGYSRNEVPWASLCAESVALCYQALGRPEDARRWMLRAWSRVLSDRKAEVESANKASDANLIGDLKEAISPVSFRVYKRRLGERMAGRIRPVYELFESPFAAADEHWQNVFLLESQARRLIRLLSSMNIKPSDDVHFNFPQEAQRPVYIYAKNTWEYYIGYISRDGVAHLVGDYPAEKLLQLGISPSELNYP